MGRKKKSLESRNSGCSGRSTYAVRREMSLYWKTQPSLRRCRRACRQWPASYVRSWRLYQGTRGRILCQAGGLQCWIIQLPLTSSFLQINIKMTIWHCFLFSFRESPPTFFSSLLTTATESECKKRNPLWKAGQGWQRSVRFGFDLKSTETVYLVSNRTDWKESKTEPVSIGWLIVDRWFGQFSEGIEVRGLEPGNWSLTQDRGGSRNVFCFNEIGILKFRLHLLNLTLFRKENGDRWTIEGQDVDHVNLYTEVDTNLLIRQPNLPFHAVSMIGGNWQDAENSPNVPKPIVDR